jgi:transcriptional regulator with XRE-family HTH domain
LVLLIRERRADLGLTQEELADRIGGSATQAEVSRLERGMIMLPRRDRLNALALEVTHGSLLLRSGWLICEEQAEVDCLAARGQHLDPPANTDMLGEVTQLHRTLLAVMKGERRSKSRCRASLDPVAGRRCASA